MPDREVWHFSTWCYRHEQQLQMHNAEALRKQASLLQRPQYVPILQI